MPLIFKIIIVVSSKNLVKKAWSGLPKHTDPVTASEIVQHSFSRLYMIVYEGLFGNSAIHPVEMLILQATMFGHFVIEIEDLYFLRNVLVVSGLVMCTRQLRVEFHLLNDSTQLIKFICCIVNVNSGITCYRKVETIKYIDY